MLLITASGPNQSDELSMLDSNGGAYLLKVESTIRVFQSLFNTLITFRVTHVKELPITS